MSDQLDYRKGRRIRNCATGERRLNGQNRVLGYRSLSLAFYPGGVWPGSRKQLITTIYQWYWSHLTAVPFRFDGEGGRPSAISGLCVQPVSALQDHRYRESHSALTGRGWPGRNERMRVQQTRPLLESPGPESQFRFLPGGGRGT
jgi:hypothetical protein